MPLFFDKSSLINKKQAQQSHRFVLRINGIDSALIKNVTVPSYTISTTSYSMLDYEFSYPGKVKWNGKVSFDIIQMLEKDVFYSSIGFFMAKLYNSNFYASPMGIGPGKRDLILPNSFYAFKDSLVNKAEFKSDPGYIREADEGTILEISKQKLGSILGTVEIRTLDEDGNAYDSWRLNGTFISSVTPTNLTYDTETISTVKVDLNYDWADYGFRGVYAEEDSVQRIFGI